MSQSEMLLAESQRVSVLQDVARRLRSERDAGRRLAAAGRWRSLNAYAEDLEGRIEAGAGDRDELAREALAVRAAAQRALAEAR